MILYHGSNMVVDHPDLNHSKSNLDFGAGFYTTSDLDQAKRWAITTTPKARDWCTNRFSVPGLFHRMAFHGGAAVYLGE